MLKIVFMQIIVIYIPTARKLSNLIIIVIYRINSQTYQNIACDRSFRLN
jgi:hypothetical protein